MCRRAGESTPGGPAPGGYPGGNAIGKLASRGEAGRGVARQLHGQLSSQPLIGQGSLHRLSSRPDLGAGRIVGAAVAPYLQPATMLSMTSQPEPLWQCTRNSLGKSASA